MELPKSSRKNVSWKSRAGIYFKQNVMLYGTWRLWDTPTSSKSFGGRNKQDIYFRSGVLRIVGLLYIWSEILLGSYHCPDVSCRDADQAVTIKYIYWIMFNSNFKVTRILSVNKIHKSEQWVSVYGREEITNISWKYNGKITTHTNELATILLNNEDEPRRLKRHKPNDLTTHFTWIQYM
jgi:hypothetical protein